MTADVHDYCRLGIVHFMLFPDCLKGKGPILETLERIVRDPFFGAVEITWIEDARVRESVRRLLRDAGLDYTYGAQPPLLTQRLDLNHVEGPARQRAVAQVLECAEEAAELGASAIAVLSGEMPSDGDIASAEERLVESLLKIGERTDSLGLGLTLETFDDKPFAKNRLVGPTERAARIAERVRKEVTRFGLMLDLSHLPLLDEAPKQALETAGDFLVHAHMGNCVCDDPTHPAYGDEHPFFGEEGGRIGAAELAEYLRGLLQVGYLAPGCRRILSFEVKPMAARGQTSEAAIENCKQTIATAWAMA